MNSSAISVIYTLLVIVLAIVNIASTAHLPSSKTELSDAETELLARILEKDSDNINNEKRGEIFRFGKRTIDQDYNQLETEEGNNKYEKKGEIWRFGKRNDEAEMELEKEVESLLLQREIEEIVYNLMHKFRDSAEQAEQNSKRGEIFRFGKKK